LLANTLKLEDPGPLSSGDEIVAAIQMMQDVQKYFLEQTQDKMENILQRTRYSLGILQ
jgi:hypothetical protein